MTPHLFFYRTIYNQLLLILYLCSLLVLTKDGILHLLLLNVVIFSVYISDLLR